jgi:phage gp29-like protein
VAQNGTGDSGPPKGSPSDSRWATQIPASQFVQQVDGALGGAPIVPKGDPAFQPPVDLLTGRAKGFFRQVYRDLPQINSIVEWQVEQMRAAIRAHMWGIFEGTGQLVDAILGDDRVQATLGSRISGLFGREVRFRPADDSMAAREVCDAWARAWPMLATASAMTELSVYSILMGWTPSQIVWSEHDKIEYCPTLRPWHPRYTYWHWNLRQYIALSQDGQIPILAGDGKWLLHAPYGAYRGWIRGAVRPVAEPWLMRHWALRDWARFSEVHGQPIKKGICPASADEQQRDAFSAALSQLATETTLLVSQGNDGVNSYDFELVEAKDTAWESFPGLRDHCDMAIVLALLFQNLTTEVKGGSFAATTAHMDIRSSGIQYDNDAWRWTIHSQLARPFAFLNFGDARLAPWTDWDVTPKEDFTHNAEQFAKFATAVEMLRRGGVEFTDSGAVQKFATERFGLRDLPDFIFTTPVAASGGGGFGK